MANICPMCGKSYKIDPENECLLTEELPICTYCGDMLDSLMYSDSSSAHKAARKYISEKRAASTNPEGKDILQQLLDDYKEPVSEPEVPSMLQQVKHASSFSAASGNDLPYVVYQVTLKEKFIGTGSGNLAELEMVLNCFYKQGYRLHTMSTATSESKGFGGGDRIQATLVFEKIDLFK